jgi:acetyl-CoA carboxylase biotin carboxyl carrier protein
MPVNIKEVRQLIKLMVDNELTELNVESGNVKVALKRGPGGEPVATVAPPPEAGHAAVRPAERPKPQAPAEKLLDIRSPMVGTFYTASSPDSDAFVALGDAVSADTVVCLIEAMKVMNEIKAECSGTVAEVCVTNAQPVEFGQVLFRVRP